MEAAIVICIVVVVGIITTLKAWYKGIDHYGWNKGSKPSVMAKISKENIEKLNNKQSGNRIETVRCRVTFEFSDGFFYSSDNLEITPLEYFDLFSPDFIERLKARIAAGELHNINELENLRYASLNALRDKAKKAHIIEAQKKTGVYYLEELEELRYVRVEKDRRKTLASVLLKIAAGVLVITAVIYIMPVFSLINGNRLMDAGDYEQAIESYSNAGLWDMNGEKLREAEEKYREASVKQIMSDFDSGNYKNAVDILSKAQKFFVESDKKILSESLMKFVDRAVSEDKYEDALSVLKSYSVNEFMKPKEDSGSWKAGSIKHDEVLKKYLAHEIETENYMKAIGLMRQYRTTLYDEEKLNDVFMKYSDKTIKELSVLESPNYNAARLRGEEITRVNAQLKYCHALYGLGYDISEVYPKGIRVYDADLSKYQITNLVNKTSDDAPGKDMKFFPMIIFSREQTTSPLSEKSPEYSVRLLPGEMFSYGSNLSAKTLSDAVCVVIADGVYIQAGIVKETSKRSGWNDYSRELPIYAAVNNLAMYDAKDPSKCVVLIIDPHDPKARDEEWLSKQNDHLYDSDRVGRFDDTAVMKNLPNVVLYSFMYRAGRVEEHNTSDDK